MTRNPSRHHTFTVRGAASVAAVEAEGTVEPTGAWNFAQAPSVESSPWHLELATRVEEAMKWSAEQELVSSWASSLEPLWPVVMHEEDTQQFDRSLRCD